MQFLHLTEYIYTGTAHGARNNYQVWLTLHSNIWLADNLLQEQPLVRPFRFCQKICPYLKTILSTWKPSLRSLLLKSHSLSSHGGLIFVLLAILVIATSLPRGDLGIQQLRQLVVKCNFNLSFISRRQMTSHARSYLAFVTFVTLLF